MDIFKRFLEAYGFKVIGTAADGQMAVDKFKSLPEKPDVILMDHRMPIKNGIEATVEILKNGCQSKIIFATADVNIREHALKVGAFGVVNKPFNFDVLINKINEVLKKKTDKV